MHQLHQPQAADAVACYTVAKAGNDRLAGSTATRLQTILELF
jgi:hypothetical protein